MGNPDGSLPEAAVEVAEIGKSFTSKKVMIGSEATEGAVRALMPKFDIIHLATHGVLDQRLPLFSYLKFSAGASPAAPAQRPGATRPAEPVAEAQLTVSKIFDMELQASLVVLSACESGLAGGYRGGEASGDELVGLARAFIYAGTPTVVATLWNVYDVSTGELMVNFYRHLRGGQVAEALRGAQAEFLKGKVDTSKVASGARGVGGKVRGGDSLLPGEHPFFWAPFIVFGDWR